MSTSIPPTTTTTATSNTTAKLSENPLRQRMHLLNRAHSLGSANGSRNLKILPLPEMTHSKSKFKEQHQQEVEGADELSPLEYETGSDSSEEEKFGVDPSPERKPPQSHQKVPPRPRVDTSSLHPPSPSGHYWRRKDRSPMSPNTRSWYEFDLAVVVALVSPVGNWLTGGDHVKNLLLVVLLIFYLHQIIEIPWSLYQKARPRRRSPQFPPDPSAPVEERYTHLASSELRQLELFFLLCTLLSPLFGALLLRYATAAVLGPESTSWFSTGLFVLATGMRPWAHLVDRLNERTMELHDFIHYPESFSPRQGQGQDIRDHDQEQVNNQVDDLERRFAKLEKQFTKLKASIAHSTEEVYDYVDDLVENMEGTLRKQESRSEKVEGQVSLVQRSLADMQRNPLRRRLNFAIFGFQKMRNAVVAGLRRWVPFASWVLGPPPPLPHPSSSPEHAITSPIAKSNSNSGSSSSSRSLRSRSAGFRSPRSASATPSLPSPLTEEVVVYESYPLLVRPIIFASGVASRCLSLLLYPLRAVVRMVLRAY